MTDHFVEVPKKVLSPAAEAVFFAAEVMQPRALAAALRALADQLRLELPLGDTDADAGVFAAHSAICDAILAIATELEPPTDEVAELVVDELTRHLLTKAATEKANRCHYSATLLTRAADLLQRQYPQPVPVSERLPEPNTKVLAYYFNSHGKGRTICAIWVPANSREVTGDDSFIISEPDEGCWTEGWYEQIENWEDLGWVDVSEGEIAYWQPLPKWPAYALPNPEVTQ